MDPVKFSLSYDPLVGIIRLTCTGQWSEKDVSRFEKDMQRMVALARSNDSVVRVLADNKTVSVQAPGVIESIGQTITSIHAQTDRIAILLDTSLAKLQMRRGLRFENMEFFVSANAALTWLMAPRVAAGQGGRSLCRMTAR